MNKTLQEVVEETVKEKISDKKSFSAHDITRAIRAWTWKDPQNNRVAQNQATIDNTAICFINHNEVKPIVHQVMNQYMNEYKITDNGTFWLYEPI